MTPAARGEGSAGPRGAEGRAWPPPALAAPFRGRTARAPGSRPQRAVCGRNGSARERTLGPKGAQGCQEVPSHSFPGSLVGAAEGACGVPEQGKCWGPARPGANPEPRWVPWTPVPPEMPAWPPGFARAVTESTALATGRHQQKERGRSLTVLILEVHGLIRKTPTWRNHTHTHRTWAVQGGVQRPVIASLPRPSAPPPSPAPPRPGLTTFQRPPRVLPPSWERRRLWVGFSSLTLTLGSSHARREAASRWPLQTFRRHSNLFNQSPGMDFVPDLFCDDRQRSGKNPYKYALGSSCKWNYRGTRP